MEAVECGAACLGIVLAYYGRWIPLEKLRADCGVSRDGSNAANMLAAGKRQGLEGDGYKLEPEDCSEIPLPCIAFWEFNHFVVVESFGRERVFLNDPAYGRRTVTPEEFDRGLSGVVLALEPGPEFERGGRPSSMVAALVGRLHGVRIAMSFCLLAGLGLVIPGLAIPAFSKIFVDEILIGGSDRWLGPLLLGMFIAGLLQAGLGALQSYYLMRAQTKLAISSMGRFLWHVLRLPMEFFSQRYAGEVSSRISSNDEVADVLTGDLATSVIGLITAIFYAALMFWYDTVLAMLGVSIALVNIVVLRLIARRQADESQRVIQDSGKLAATAMGGIQGIESIKASAREADLFSRWAGYQAKASAAEQRLGVATGLLAMVPAGLTMLSTAIVLGVGGFYVMQGSLTIGTLVAFQVLLASFSRPIHDLVGLAGTIQQLVGDMKRLDDVSNYEIDEAFSDGAGAAPAPLEHRLSGFLEIRDVVFGYSRLSRPLLEGFSLKLSPGDRVALVGASGSGKSTVARLIAGLYRPWSGEILVDGMPRQEIPQARLANSLAMVDQDICLFEGTVRENLSLWDPTLPDPVLQRAAKDSCIHDDITDRRGAYSSAVEEGGRNFSGGQRQRLEIARALASNPSIIVLDEATSALDATTEKIVDENIRRRGCTCVVVAHRLSTIRDCNEIIVLDRGKVVQRGTHEELMSQPDSAYARLISTE
jgi:NHLM bacteriocin system ABC transporter peptidase/ATP-binding protein